MDYDRIGVLQLDGENYAFWSKKMKTYVHAHRFDVWQAVVDGYKAPATPPIDKDGNKLEDNDSIDINVILNELIESVYTKVVHCESKK
jgi:hypothetical protein